MNTCDEVAPRERDPLRQWHAALANRRIRAAVHVATGDSVTEGVYGVPVEFYRSLLARRNDGVTSVGWVNASPEALAIRYRFTLTNGTPGRPGQPNSNVMGGLANYSYRLGSDSMLSLQRAGHSFALHDAKVMAKKITFYWTKQRRATAGLELWVDDALVKVLDRGDLSDPSLPVAHQSGQSWEWETASSQPTLVHIRVRTTGVGVEPIFDGCYIDEGDLIRVYNAGHAGHNHRDVLDNAGHAQFLERLQPDLITDAHGINDVIEDVDGFLSLMQRYHDLVFSAPVERQPSLVFVTPYRSSVHGASWDRIPVAAALEASRLGDGHIDMAAAMGAHDNDELFADGAHLTLAGGRRYASAMAAVLIDGWHESPTA